MHIKHSKLFKLDEAHPRRACSDLTNRRAASDGVILFSLNFAIEFITHSSPIVYYRLVSSGRKRAISIDWASSFISLIQFFFVCVVI